MFFHTSRRKGGLDALSVVNPCAQRRRPYTPHGRRTRRPSHPVRFMNHGQRQTDVPTEQPPPREGARVPTPHAHARRSFDLGVAASQGPCAARRLTCGNGRMRCARARSRASSMASARYEDVASWCSWPRDRDGSPRSRASGSVVLCSATAHAGSCGRRGPRSDRWRAGVTPSLWRAPRSTALRAGSWWTR